MASPRFFHPEPLATTAIGGELSLIGSVAHHAIRVLRINVGDAITLFDGMGGEYRATIVAVERRDVRARLVSFDPVEREAEPPVTLVLAAISADPMEIAIRKAVELGVAAIAPVTAARSQRASGVPQAERRLAHWRQIAIAACEQCGRNRVPTIDAAVALAQWLSAFVANPAPAVLLAPGASRSLAASVATRPPRCILVGPEGGWTSNEINQAVECGIDAVHLGPRALRTETAVIAALSTVNALAGDAR